MHMNLIATFFASISTFFSSLLGGAQAPAPIVQPTPPLPVEAHTTVTTHTDIQTHTENTVSSSTTAFTDKASGAKYTFNNDVTFQVPWNHEDNRRGTNSLALIFNLNTPAQASIGLFSASPLLENVIGGDPKLSAAFGSPTSNYGLYAYISKEGAIKDPGSSVAQVRNVLEPGSPASVFTTRNGMRAFEYALSKGVMINFFTPKDIEYTMTFSGMTPDQIDSIIQSVKEL
ncbi:MAG: hypothetical protein JWL88_663 [Parcubacteria group bacterium]|nr:hypothetical protein [Parcubacteria group bacterium]